MSVSPDKLALPVLTIGAGIVSTTITRHGVVARTVFDGPDAATYDWKVLDNEGEFVTGREDQVGDNAIVEEYPLKPGFTFNILDSDTVGDMEVILWLKR